MINPRLLAIAGLAVLLAGYQTAEADPSLRPSAVVSGDYVRLGDLFDGVGDRADVVVARSPQPGQRVTEDAGWLKNIAVANGLKWTPDNAFIQTVIDRPGEAIGQNLIQDALKQALVAQGMQDTSEIEVTSGISGAVVVAANGPTNVGVDGLSYDPRSQRFSASVSIPAGSPTATRMAVSGKVYDTVEVPVLIRAPDRGDVLTARDFTTVRMRKDQLRPDAILDVAAIAGLAARQPLRSGDPVTSNDVQKQLVVNRNTLVTVVLQTATMTITAQGRALDSGSVGDVVRVLNTRSNLTVQGRVDGPDMVSVLPAGSVALAN